MKKAMQSFVKLLNGIPKGKYQNVSADAAAVEVWMRKSGALLGVLRGYFLDTTGEASPFVRKIDELVERPEATPNGEGGAR